MSLKLGAQAAQNLVERYGFGSTLLNLGITPRRQGVPLIVSSCVGIQARDHPIQESGAINRREAENFRLQSFEGG